MYGEEIGVVGLDIPASGICVTTGRFTHRDIKPHILSVDQDLVKRREALDGVPSDLSDLSTKFPRSERDVIRNSIQFGYNVPRLWEIRQSGCMVFERVEVEDLQLVRSIANLSSR